MSMDLNNLTGTEITAVADDLLEASVILGTWAKRLRIDNADNERREDIQFLSDRSRQYQASAYKLIKKCNDAKS